MIQYTINAVEKVEVERSWKERLFSLPWRPFEKKKIIDKPTIFVVGETIIAHPVFKSRLDEHEKKFREELNSKGHHHMNPLLDLRPIFFADSMDPVEPGMCNPAFKLTKDNELIRYPFDTEGS
jgi:hypothetical protein